VRTEGSQGYKEVSAAKSTKMAETPSNSVRLYTRFISILKIIQYIGYSVVVFFSLTFVLLTGGFQSFFPPIALVIILLQATLGCLIIYVITQGLIAIIDLLSRIEQNTRSQ
jgi:hypothetical protein